MACNLLLKKSLMELNQSSINPWHLSIKDVPLRTLNYLQSFELDKIWFEFFFNGKFEIPKNLSLVILKQQFDCKADLVNFNTTQTTFDDVPYCTNTIAQVDTLALFLFFLLLFTLDPFNIMIVHNIVRPIHNTPLVTLLLFILQEKHVTSAPIRPPPPPPKSIHWIHWLVAKQLISFNCSFTFRFECVPFLGRFCLSVRCASNVNNSNKESLFGFGLEGLRFVNYSRFCRFVL